MNSTDKLVDAFEAGEIDNSDFPHERHVRVAWGLAQCYEPNDAFRRLVAGIRGIAARAGRPDAYHETITRAWFELIASAEQLDRNPELFDKSLLLRYYSPERLAAGRERWLEPDLHPLGLPPPDSKPEEADVKAALRRIPTGVAVLAVRGNGTVHATTVSSITSVSMEPALVSVCLASDSRALGLVHDAKAFTLSVLAFEQDGIADRFADPERPAGAVQFAGIPHHLSPYGPVIDTATAWIGCSVHAVHRCGDHHIVVGRVELAEATDRRPLLRHDGTYH